MHEGKPPSFISSATCTSVSQKLDAKPLCTYANRPRFGQNKKQTAMLFAMLFLQGRMPAGGRETQEPVFWINWEKETLNIKRKEPAASQKREKLTKHLCAAQIRGWGFLSALHGFLMAIKAGGKAKATFRERISYFSNRRKTCPDQCHHAAPWTTGSLHAQGVSMQLLFHSL